MIKTVYLHYSTTPVHFVLSIELIDRIPQMMNHSEMSDVEISDVLWHLIRISPKMSTTHFAVPHVNESAICLTSTPTFTPHVRTGKAYIKVRKINL